MKKLFFLKNRFSFSFILLSVLILLYSCTDHQAPPPVDPPSGDYSDEIKKTITQDNIDKIRALGVNVCEGTQVGNLEGIFLNAPNLMTKTTVPNDFPIGHRFVDYRYRIKNQDTTKLIAEVDLKGISNGSVVDEANGKAALLSGNGNCFTIFVIQEGSFPNGSRYRTLDVYSGEKTATGIKNFQSALLMLEDYGDKNNDLIAINTGRAFHDSDGFSEFLSSFRQSALTTDTEKLHPRTYFIK